jgi:hypothetical protein
LQNFLETLNPDRNDHRWRIFVVTVMDPPRTLEDLKNQIAAVFGREHGGSSIETRVRKQSGLYLDDDDAVKAAFIAAANTVNVGDAAPTLLPDNDLFTTETRKLVKAYLDSLTQGQNDPRLAHLSTTVANAVTPRHATSMAKMSSGTSNGSSGGPPPMQGHQWAPPSSGALPLQTRPSSQYTQWPERVPTHVRPAKEPKSTWRLSSHKSEPLFGNNLFGKTMQLLNPSNYKIEQKPGEVDTTFSVPKNEVIREHIAIYLLHVTVDPKLESAVSAAAKMVYDQLPYFKTNKRVDKTSYSCAQNLWDTRGACPFFGVPHCW